MSVKSLVTVVLALLLLAACTLVGDRGTTQPTEPPPPDPIVIALEAAQAFLEAHLGRELQGIQVAYGPSQWADTSLGCPQDGIVPDEKTVTGYTFEMTVDGTLYELHTNKDGSIVVLCPEGGTEPEPPLVDLSPPAEIEKPLERAKLVLAEALGVPLESLDPGEVAWEAKTFPNSGLGCPEPNTAYLEVLTDGYAFTFTLEDRAVNIHTDLTGDNAVLCPEEETAAIEEPPAESAKDLPASLEAPYLKAFTLLAEALETTPDALSFEAISWEEATFPSTALGCPEEGVVYAAVEIEGYILSLTHAGIQYKVHTDQAGANGVICNQGGEGQAAAAPAGSDEPPALIFTSYGDDTLGFGISFPLGWAVEPAEAEGEVLFGPAAGFPTLGMTVSRLAEPVADTEALHAAYQVTLYNNDPTAIEMEEPHQVGLGGQSRLYSRAVEGTPVLERVTFFPEGYRVLQWCPMVERTRWNDAFVQMLNSLVLTGSPVE